MRAPDRLRLAGRLDPLPDGRPEGPKVLLITTRASYESLSVFAARIAQDDARLRAAPVSGRRPQDVLRALTEGGLCAEGEVSLLYENFGRRQDYPSECEWVPESMVPPAVPAEDMECLLSEASPQQLAAALARALPAPAAPARRPEPPPLQPGLDFDAIPPVPEVEGLNRLTDARVEEALGNEGSVSYTRMLELVRRIAATKKDGEELRDGEVADVENDTLYEQMCEFINEARDISGEKPFDLAD